MMKVNLLFCVVTLLFLLTSLSVKSDVVLPGDKNFNIRLVREISDYINYDSVIINEKSGHDSEHPEYYRRNHWHCFSETDSSTGACPVTASTGVGEIAIKLDFTEENTKLTFPMVLSAYTYTYDCWDGYGKGINSIEYSVCGSRTSHGKRLQVALPRLAHHNIPYGGTWKATLKLRQRNYSGPGEGYNAVWTANIVLKVSDKNNISVYFPEFHSSTPTVDLNLQTHASITRAGQLIDGVKTLDMCLYDGRNAGSDWYDVTITDETNISGRNRNIFSVLKENSTGNSERERIDYRVILKHNGSDIEVQNNRLLRLTDISSAEQQIVTLPKMTRPVICTPTPLTLITPQFDQMGKEEGAYSGKLKVIFTPSTFTF